MATETHMTGEGGEHGLHRGLSQRHLSMIAIGGAIGVGLFLGSTVTISLAGPGVIVTYLIGAVIAMILAYALAEMAVIHPVAGSFGVYAEQYLSRWAGFAVRTTYGFIQIIAIGAEVTAVAIYFTFWFPGVPQWVWVAVFSTGLILLTAAPVARFGEFQYWFSLIKVVAIIAFILVGAALIFGLGPWPATGFANLTAHGGFLPHGWRGVWLALTLGITSYMGVEVIAITAGEAERPEITIPRAMRTIVYRLIIFYVLAISVIVTMLPWTKTGSGTITGSPFVVAFARIGVPYAAGIMNLVVISAALSSANTNLYTTTRMLFSLGRGGYLPRWLGHLTGTGVPLFALLTGAAGMVAAIVLSIFRPRESFLIQYGTAVAGMFFVWIVILLTHLKFRQRLDPDRLARLPLRLPFHPLPTVAGIAAMLGISVATFYVDGLQYTIPAFLPFLAVVTLIYLMRRGKAAKA
jgi:L-asparagine transporter-like permease